MKQSLLIPMSILLLPLLATPAFAQVADLLGVAKDETGAVLPGVLITADHVETGLTRTTTTDSRGLYRIVSVPAGAWKVTAELPGFQTVVREGITLSINMKANINFVMKVAGVSETITVTGESPIVETTTSEVGVTMTKQVIDDIPLNGRNPTDLLLLAPGVAPGRQRGGYAVAGSLERNNSYTIDGIDNNDDWVGGRRVDLQQDVVREFQLITNQFSAKYGRGVGGSVNILTQSGTNEYRGRVNFFLRDDAIQATPYLSKEAGIEKTPFRRLTYGGSFGGPIVRDKTHFFVSFEEERETEHVEFDLPNITYPAVGPYPEIQGGFRTAARKPNNPRLFAKGNHLFNEDHSLSITFNYHDSNNPLAGCSGTDLQCYDVGFKDWLFNTGWTWVLSSNTLNELRVAWTKYEAPFYVHEGQDFTGHSRPGISYGQQSNMPQGRDERHLFITDTYSKIFSWKGDHDFSVGGEVNVMKGYAFFPSNFGGTYSFDTDAPFDPNDRSTYPYRYTVRTGNPNIDSGMNLFSAFIQDNWRIQSNLTLNLGVRYDLEILGDQFRYTNQEGVISLPQLADDMNFQVDKNNFAPRIGFAWDPWDDGKTSIRGGFGLYYDQVFLNIQLNNFLFGVVPRTFDTTIDDPCYPDPSLTIPGVCGETIIPGQPSRSPIISSGYERSPYALNTSIGFQREIARDVAVTADFVRVRTWKWPVAHDFNPRCTFTGTLEGDCTGPLNSDASRPDSEWRALRHYATEGDKWYEGFLVGLRKRYSDNYGFQISYTLAKTEDNAADFGSDPQSYFHPEREKSLSREDQRHRLVIGGSWLIPGDVRMSGVLTYSNGRPFNITMGTDWNGNGNSEQDRPDSIPTEQNIDVGTADTRPYNPAGSRGMGADGVLERYAGHGPDFFSIDLRASKIFRFGGHYSVELLGEFFNLTNRVNVGEPSGNVRSSQYYLRRLMRGEIADTSTFDPFQAQIGIRFNF